MSEGFTGNAYQCAEVVSLPFAYCEKIGWCIRLDADKEQTIFSIGSSSSP
jgi:hypothetical protein